MYKRGFMKDMDKTQLLKMREDQQMSNSEIALAVGCSEMMIYRAIGPMPAEMRKKIFQVPADMLGTFIEELQAIQKNMNTVQSAPFWG